MKSLALYNPVQMEQIQSFIHKTFGGDENSMVAHEITSEYVHTDTLAIVPEDSDRVFVTFGMGARKMNAPHPDFEHIELVMFASHWRELSSEKVMTIINELVSLSKFPFRKETWLGHGHTIEASDVFRESFGFEALTFCHTGEVVELEGIGRVNFLAVVPIYAEEREWFMQCNSVACLDDLYDYLGEEMFLVDSGRDPGLPVEWCVAKEVLGLDPQKLEQLQAFLAAAEDFGEEITYEMIDVWLQETHKTTYQKHTMIFGRIRV